jgi:hypothetical protein
MRRFSLCLGFAAAALALPALGVPRAEACGLLWACAERQPFADRGAPRAYGYRSRPRAYRHRGAWWYGYTSPARAYGDPYAAWPSTAIPPTRWYLGTALPAASTNTVGLTSPVASAYGLSHGGMPARGPTLFGPNSAPTGGWGYYYGGYYYGAPAYGYYAAPSRWAPPRETPSWWVEPRRRR